MEIETDDGRRQSGQGGEQERLEDWDLDLEEARRTRELRSRPGMVRPKLVHKVVFSMPAGTPPDGLFRAARMPGRLLAHNIAMRWCCIRTSQIRTYTWL
jgi:hypothetical protein